MPEICPICEGLGLHITRRPDGSQFAEPCPYRLANRTQRMIDRSQIPKRYEHCAFENFNTKFQGADISLAEAKLIAKGFVGNYLHHQEGTGLLLVGTAGLGKTHLAVSILRELITERAATGLFCDYRDLLKQVQNSYNRQVNETELEVLRPVFDAEILVLDELGASKPTDWVWDTVAHILNTRYNERRTTIITTNFANLPPLSGAKEEGKSSREDTLGDRIGERMRSRLQEMCVVTEMQGQDFRQTVKRARFI